MAKGYVPIFFDWIENTQDLSAEEKGHLIDAVMLYASGSDEWIDALETSGEKIAFRFMRGQIDRNNAISSKRSAAGSNKHEQNENKTEQNETKTINNNKNKKENKNKKQEQEQKQKLFDRFWSAYPRKESKPAARRAFDKIGVDETLLETMLSAIEKQKSSPQWNKDNGEYIPHPATWLNNQRWLDEVKPSQLKTYVSAQQYEQRDYSGVQEEMLDRQQKEIEEKLRRKAVI